MRRLCALYDVTRAGYYAWRGRGESPRRGQDRRVLSTIRALFEGSRGTYGSPRIHQALRAAGTRISRRRVERLMREGGLRARAAKLYRAIPGLHAFFTSVPNRQLDRLTTSPDQVWVGDITYLKVGHTWRYLAVVMDRYSRRIVGWSMSGHKDAGLTLAALNHAVFNRRPQPGLFFHSMKTDVVHGVSLASQDDVDRLLRSYIPYYNRVRLHSGLGYRSPVDYEAQHA